jgi:acetyl-CoA carboxylase carboxyl transferase subunit beta
MAWMRRFRKRDMPGGLWVKCPECKKMLFQKELVQNSNVCTDCSYHFPLTVAERIACTLDEGSFDEVDALMTTVDALSFVDSAPYPEKLEATRRKTGRCEGMVFGTGRVCRREIVFGALEFGFLGGSMGVVVGEKVTRAAELAKERGLPLILCSRSGGARMHEGALSLMQMAKSCAAVGRLHESGGLYISILAHPTTGGVTASWATMADFVLAEPKAQIGFAGPRVIQNTIRQELPEGFQTAEFLLKRGQLDQIVPRTRMIDTLDRILTYCLGPIAAEERPAEQAPAAEAPTEDPVEARGAKDEEAQAAAARNGAVPHEATKQVDRPDAGEAAGRSTGSSATPAPAAPARGKKGAAKNGN